VKSLRIRWLGHGEKLNNNRMLKIIEGWRRRERSTK
jgi:hypothetical protein